MRRFLKAKFWQLCNHLSLNGKDVEDDSDAYSMWMIGQGYHWEAGREDSFVLDVSTAWLSIKLFSYALTLQVIEGKDGSAYRSGLLLERVVQHDWTG